MNIKTKEKVMGIYIYTCIYSDYCYNYTSIQIKYKVLFVKI